MKLGYISLEARGAGDRLLSTVAHSLQAQGLRLAGAVQDNIGGSDTRRCDMILRLLGRTDRITISQYLGPGATGCRLNADAFTQAVGHVSAQLTLGADLLIVNKFAQQELDGGGFRELIGQALSQDIPVLTAVKPAHLDGFRAYAEGLATHLPADATAICDWATQGISIKG